MGLNSYLVAVIPPYSPLGWRQIYILQTSIDFVSLNMFLMSNKKPLSIVNTKHSNVACANANTCLFMWCINGQRRKRICLISFLHQKWKSEMLLGLIHKSSCKVVWELKTGPSSPLHSTHVLGHHWPLGAPLKQQQQNVITTVQLSKPAITTV